LSGGVDSSYLAYVLVKKYNIRPLAIHVDNGWNSEIAVGNIQKIVSRLGIDLYTHVIQWEEFRDLQRSFIKASVIDLEMLSDHAIVVITKKIAQKFKIDYFVIGSNYQTESILPTEWFYPFKHDSLNIKDIYKKYGDNKRLSSFPFISFYKYLFFQKGYGSYLSPLSYLEYDKDKAKKILIEELDWKDYGAKHHESFITKFYQNYILPTKFNIDKRKAHLSSLICANQITREEALLELNKPVFASEHEKQESIEYFCKKLQFNINDFHKMMSENRREHSCFKSYETRKNIIRKYLKYLKKK
jgi:hypothetical protein